MTKDEQAVQGGARKEAVERMYDEHLDGWNLVFSNNDDVVYAYRWDGGALTEAYGVVEEQDYSWASTPVRRFLSATSRITVGAVHPVSGRSLNRPTEWRTA